MGSLNYLEMELMKKIQIIHLPGRSGAMYDQLTIYLDMRGEYYLFAGPTLGFLKAPIF